MKEEQARDVRDYISGGYFLVQRTPLPEKFSALLPEDRGGASNLGAMASHRVCSRGIGD